MIKNKNDFKIGDRVKVFSLMNPKRDYKGEDTIISISPMCSGGEIMLWLRKYGAYHPDACERINDCNEAE